ncbi:ABC transporter ATP-binding protein [Heyndrickxia acidicola]|uniref:ABC transporter ATP-binding protein n=1 Tax=Heyndrickxia acidicola TaxID=209389 RepID=A0ABU6MKI7_9BACI|nr:ABC transporter ATP-binding protein [Heyndrickxia acidicola]MED1204501.1 ABC transporter ATP-binding protein [Heyndrickxia acidicola]
MIIELKKVVKTFSRNQASFTAIKGAELTIDKGEFVSIIGKSGSGKSTLLNMMTGIDHPTSGEVYILDTNLGQMRRSELSKWRGLHIGIVFQFFQLLPGLTLLENVMLPMDFCRCYLRKERREKAYQLLSRVGLEMQANQYPSEISGGQQQRAAIARALANNPPIIVADEPTGSLDEKTAASVLGLFKELVAEGKTVVIVTHDLSIASQAGKKIRVVDGEVKVDNRVDRSELHSMEERLEPYA